MGGTRKFLLNAVFLSAVSVAARSVSVSFNAYVATRVGAECTGLVSLVSSVASLSVIIACAGVNIAVVRSVSAAIASCAASGEDPTEKLRRTVRSAALYCLVFGVFTGGAVFSFSRFIASNLLGDERCLMSLRAFAASLPAISLSSCLSGYFMGTGRIWKCSLCTLAAEAFKILFVAAGLVFIAPRGDDYACLAIVGGGAASEAASLFVALLLFAAGNKKK